MSVWTSLRTSLIWMFFLFFMLFTIRKNKYFKHAIVHTLIHVRRANSRQLIIKTKFTICIYVHCTFVVMLKSNGHIKLMTNLFISLHSFDWLVMCRTFDYDLIRINGKKVQLSYHLWIVNCKNKIKTNWICRWVKEKRIRKRRTQMMNETFIYKTIIHLKSFNLISTLLLLLLLLHLTILFPFILL